MRCLNLLAAGMFLCAASCAFPAASPLQITEFAAAGRQGLTDEDGDTPDWIEIQNISAEETSLSGWTLTDDSRRRQEWRFPATNVPPGGFLVVLASGRDRRVPGSALHTHFKLGADVGSLFLRGPGGDLSKIERYDNIDLPQCISYCVAMALISSGDHGHKNFYVYRDTRGSGEWALLPWDVDLSWGRNWMNQYFNENLFVDNPLNLYRAGHDKARNRLYNLLFEHPEFRQMYLRRLRTVMDELLQPPGTPPQSLIIERRVRELMDLLDPPEFKPSDADLDDAAWPKWGNRASVRSEAQRIIDEYLPGRRNFLFKSSRATLLGDSIPAAQRADMTLQFLEIDSRSPVAEQFVCITNQNNFAVDITGWRLVDAGLEHRFRPGTVIPAGQAIYAVADAAAFRRRSTGPCGGQSLLVQGKWKGALKSGFGALKLIDAKERVVASRAVP